MLSIDRYGVVLASKSALAILTWKSVYISENIATMVLTFVIVFPPFLNYSLDTAYIVIVIVALAEELLALLILLVTSLSGILVSAIEVPVSDITDAGKIASIITSTTRAIKKVRFFLRTVWLKHHRLPVK